MRLVPHGDLEKRGHKSIRVMLVAAQEKVLREMKETKKNGDGRDGNKGIMQYYIDVKERRERRNIIRTESFQVLKQLEVKA